MNAGRAAPATTFRRRLLLSALTLSFGTLAVTSVAVYLGAAEALRSNLDDALLSIAHTEVASALDGPEDPVHVHPPSPRALNLPAGSGYEKLVQIVDEQGQVIARTPNLVSGPALAAEPAAEARAWASRQAVCTDLRRGAAPWRAVYYPLRDRGGRPLLAVVAIAKEPMEHSLQSLLAIIGLCLALGGWAAAWVSSHLAERLTRPLERIATAARTVSEGRLDERIAETDPDEELRYVAHCLNDMLDRLQQAFADQAHVVEAQRRFVADASHELRSPLANLRGTVEVALRRDRSAADYRETLTQALAEVERLSRLVNDLLLLSRADAGQLPPPTGRCDLARVARQAASACEARAAAVGVRLSVAADGPLEVVGDADRLRQVIDNLLDNALRYAPAGTAIEVAAHAKGREAGVTVRDHGPGLALGEPAQVFERFARADPARARGSGGAGLGLAIAEAIVRLHGGRISVHSVPGQGAEFGLRLARAPDAPTEGRPGD